jgi:cell wall-associated NlpC family hydrolase
MPPGQAAQSVQISAFPAAYDQWLTAARAWLLQLTGKAAPTGLNTACGLGSVAGLGALTTIPDYDIDPLLLKSLQTAVTRAQGQALAAQREYKAGQVKVTAARAQAAEMHTEAAQARVVAEQKRQQLQSILARAYVTGNSQLSPALTYLLSRTAASATAELNDLTSLTYLADRQDQQLMDALTAIAKADRLAVQADQATAAANAEAADLKTAYDTAENRVRSLTAQLQAEVKAIQAALAAKQAAGKASAATSLAKWQAYKGLLASAHVVAPAAAELADPSALPKGLTPVLDSSGHPVAGAAKAHTTHGDLLVLPREVIAAVDSALSKLGAPYVFGATGPTSFDCSGLVMSSYATGGLSIPRTSQAQFSYTTASRIAPGQELPGDLVFFAGSDGTNDAPGHVGMVLDASSELMIQAPQTGDVVKISSYGDTPVVGFGRVSITG